MDLLLILTYTAICIAIFAYSDLLEHLFRFYLNTSDQRIVG